MITKPVIALLFPGDMGTQIAKELIKNNFKVITAGEGRSSETLQNILSVGIEDLGSLQNVADNADIIISLSSPQGSLRIAKLLIVCLKNTKNRPPFIDLNSNTPAVASAIEKLFSQINIRFVNGAIMGPSKDVPCNATIVVSGKYRNLFIEPFSEIFKIKDAGKKTEAASAYKLLFSMVNKGINALFFETMTAAAHFGILDELNESLQEFLPGTYQDLLKTTPTYPQHIFRRIEEMRGISEMLKSENLPNGIVSAAVETFERVFISRIFENEKNDSVVKTLQCFKKTV